MSDKSAIEWTDATWNPVTGCTKVSQGCKNCYAEREWPRLQHLPAYAGRAFTDVRCHPDRLNEPLRWRRPRKIFVCHNADLFHEAVPDNFIDLVFAVMALSSRHTFQVLTKRPERMLNYLSRVDRTDLLRHRALCDLGIRPGGNSRKSSYFYWDGERWQCTWPLPNIWLGVSVEDQATADERIPLLLQTPAAVRWVSAEPLLSPILLCDSPNDMGEPRVDWLRGMEATPPIPRLDWIVAGGESGPKARPSHPDWVRSLRDQCQAAGVPFFFKRWGEWAPDAPVSKYADSTIKMDDGTYLRFVGKKRAGRMLDGREWNEYPA